MTGHGIAKAVTPSAKINGFQSAVTRGRESEARVLQDLNLPKNTKKYTINGNSVIPDAVTDTHIIEIKDTKIVSQTKQIKTHVTFQQ